MRKRVFGRKFNRNTDQRQQLFRNLMRSFILHGKLKTTEAKISAVRGEVERMVTKARNKGESSERILMRRLPDSEAVKKLINEVAPKFVGRNGGYTRVLKLGERVKDAAPMAILQWVEVMDKTVTSTKRVKKDTTKAKVMDADIVVPKEEKKAKKTKTK